MTTAQLIDQAAVQILVWRRKSAATWRTVSTHQTERAARRALSMYPTLHHARARVLSGVSESLVLGALTRDSFI